jgi:uncharacterized membrane protein
MGRGLTVLLILSLAANVFLGGFVAGRFVGGPPHHPHLMPMPGDLSARGAFRDLEALTPEERDAFRAVFKQKRGEFRKTMHDVFTLRTAFGEALAADPWDRARVEKALADLTAAEGARQTAVSMLLIDAFETLPAEKRKALVEEASKHPGDWRSHRDRRRKFDRRLEPPPGEGPPPDEEETVPPPD